MVYSGLLLLVIYPSVSISPRSNSMRCSFDEKRYSFGINFSCDNNPSSPNSIRALFTFVFSLLTSLVFIRCSFPWEQIKSLSSSKLQNLSTTSFSEFVNLTLTSVKFPSPKRTPKTYGCNGNSRSLKSTVTGCTLNRLRPPLFRPMLTISSVVKFLASLPLYKSSQVFTLHIWSPLAFISVPSLNLTLYTSNTPCG